MLLDARGEKCPEPMRKAMEAMQRLPPGEDLEVLVDYRPAVDTIRMAANSLGFQMDVVDAGGSQWRITLRRRSQQGPVKQATR